MAAQQFTIKNIDGVLYLVDQSPEHPTNIKVTRRTGFRLFYNDFVSLGLSEYFRVIQCTSTKTKDNEELLKTGDKEHYNIRYVPNGYSKGADSLLAEPAHYGEPKLSIMFYKVSEINIDILDLDMDIPADKPYSIGRHSTNQLWLKGGFVSKKHCIIEYNKTFGWCIIDQDQGDEKDPDKCATSGTWVHPRRHAEATTCSDNSKPVEIKSGTFVKACSYVFKFTIDE